MSKEYDIYLKEHRHGVLHAYQWLGKHGMIFFYKYTLFYNIANHDASKFEPEEYDAYDKYFYGERTPEVKEDFDTAWLHHIHCNPHHWQYWVLINDDESDGTKALMMPNDYVIEMICDWWSFSWKTGNLYEIFDWYEEHKDRMILHKNTRELVEEILNDIRTELDKEKQDD